MAWIDYFCIGVRIECELNGLLDGEKPLFWDFYFFCLDWYMIFCSSYAWWNAHLCDLSVYWQVGIEAVITEELKKEKEMNCVLHVI